MDGAEAIAEDEYGKGTPALISRETTTIVVMVAPLKRGGLSGNHIQGTHLALPKRVSRTYAGPLT